MTYYTESPNDIDIDMSQIEKDTSFDPIPNGEYLLEAVEVKLTLSKVGNRMLNVQYRVVSGEYANRRIFETYNIEHHNPKVGEIAMRQLKSWMIAVGFTGNERMTMALLDAMKGREFLGMVRIEEDKSHQYPPQNRVKAYKPSQTAATYTPAPAPYAPPPPSPRQMPPQVPPQMPPPAYAQAPARPWESAGADVPF